MTWPSTCWRAWPTGRVGLVLLAAGYVAIDLLTPGRLSDLIYRDRNWNAAAVVASGLIAIATIVVTAILTSHDDLDKGLAYAGSFGMLGRDPPRRLVPGRRQVHPRRPRRDSSATRSATRRWS